MTRAHRAAKLAERFDALQGFELRPRDSNPDYLVQSEACCHYTRPEPESEEEPGPGAPQSKAAALALGTLPLMHFGPWPGLGRIWKLVTAWKGVVEPSFWARVMTRR